MQSLDRLFELLCDDALAHHDLLQPFTKLRRRDTAVGREFHEALFLSLQITKRSLQRRHGVGISVDHALERLCEQLPQLRDDVGVEAYELELVDDLIFDVFDPEAGRGATNAVAGGAGVVLVRSAVAGVLAVHESTETPGGVAGAADEVAPQVMEVLHVAVAIAVARVQDRLHFDEEFLRHNGLVPAGVEASFVADDAGVVRIAKDLRQARLVDRTSRAARSRSHSQPLIGEHVGQLCDRTAARCVLFEGPTDKRRPIWVYVDRVDEAPAELFPDVEVAELGTPDGAALFDLVCHLHAHVLAVHADLHFVHHVGDGFHRVGHVADAELFFRRDQAHAYLEEFALRDGCVGEVSEDAGAHVDDDVLHLRVLVDVAHHFLELGAGDPSLLMSSARFASCFDALAWAVVLEQRWPELEEIEVVPIVDGRPRSGL